MQNSNVREAVDIHLRGYSYRFRFLCRNDVVDAKANEKNAIKNNLSYEDYDPHEHYSGEHPTTYE